jgi:hypothetical protein
MRSLAVGLALGAAACAAVPGEPQADEAVSAEDALGEMADPFILTISVERYGYLIDLARQGAIEGPPAMIREDPPELARATRATIEAAHSLYALRERVCATGLAGPEQCGPLPPPEWLGAPVGEVADVVEINRRVDWLTSVMWPFVEAGCDAGRSRQGPDDPDFCAVE